MSEGFYERLGVVHDASPDEIKSAYQRKLAELVRRLRTARRRGADVSILESRERALREAIEVLQDRNRRRQYDAFLETYREGLPEDADELWSRVGGSMVDPVAAAALASVRALTDLPTGDPLAGVDVDNGVQQQEEAPPPTVRTQVVVEAVAEEMPTVADEIREAEPDSSQESSAFGMSTLEVPLPVAREELFEDEPAAPPAMVRVEPPREPARPEVTLDGKFLAKIRAEKGIGMNELSANTRISERYLIAIEENSFDKLPAAPFVRGYVRQVAQILGVENSGVVEGFMDMYNHHRG